MKTVRSVEIGATAVVVALVEIVAEAAVVVASVVSVVVQAQARVAMGLEARHEVIVVMAPEARRVVTAVTDLVEALVVSVIVIAVVKVVTTARLNVSGCPSRRTFR